MRESQISLSLIYYILFSLHLPISRRARLRPLGGGAPSQTYILNIFYNISNFKLGFLVPSPILTLIIIYPILFALIQSIFTYFFNYFKCKIIYTLISHSIVDFLMSYISYIICALDMRRPSTFYIY